MSIQLSTQILTFTENNPEITYTVKVTPTTDSLKIVVEGEYEIAIANNNSRTFVKELILLADTTQIIPKIEREIVVRKKEKAGEGRILHSLSNKPESVILPLRSGERVSQPLVQPKITEPVQPTVSSLSFDKAELEFGKSLPGEIRQQVLVIRSSGLERYSIEVNLPFRISKDNKLFLSNLTYEVNPKGDSQKVYVQFQPTKAGSHKQSLLIRAQSLPLRQVLLHARCKEKSVLKMPKLPVSGLMKGIALLLLGVGLTYIVKSSGLFSTKKKEIHSIMPSEPILPAAYNDPTCKPSMYKKLKEKTAIVKYGCVTKDCDTTFIRDVLINASGSKAFGFVDLHKDATISGKCGQWIGQIFQSEKADILFTKENCSDVSNVDQSHHLCDDNTIKPECMFILPCGNSEGLLKVINKEIRKRKAKMNILD